MSDALARAATKAAHWWLDRHARAPRLDGFSVDDGLPDRGQRYGGAQTIHNTGTVDVVIGTDGRVTEVWFRCQQLQARVSHRHDHAADYQVAGAALVAVELAR